MLRISSATRASTSSRSGNRAGVGSTGKLEAVYRLSRDCSITKSTKSAVSSRGIERSGTVQNRFAAYRVLALFHRPAADQIDLAPCQV